MADERLRVKDEEKAVIPPREAVVADLMWIKSIVIDCPGPQHEASIRVEYIPMTADGQLVPTGPDGRDYTRQVGTGTLYADKAQVPELDVAFKAFLAAIKPMEAFKDAQKKVEE